MKPEQQMRGTSLHPSAGRHESPPQMWVTGDIVTGTERLLKRNWLLSPERKVEEPSCFRGRSFCGTELSYNARSAVQKGTYLYVMRPSPVGAEASTLLQASPLLFQKGFIPMQFVLSAIPNILGK